VTKPEADKTLDNEVQKNMQVFHLLYHGIKQYHYNSCPHVTLQI